MFQVVNLKSDLVYTEISLERLATLRDWKLGGITHSKREEAEEERCRIQDEYERVENRSLI